MYLDLKFAVRRLLATPLFTIFAVLSLAAGVGVTTAVYSVVDSIFLKQSQLREPDRVAMIVWPRDGRLVNAALSLPDFRDLRDAQRSFTALSASTSWRPNVTTSVGSETMTVEAVDGAYFRVLGVASAVGRLIGTADDTGAARVAVLSDTLWRQRYAADPAIVGRTIRISDVAFEVVGVAHESFVGPGAGMFTTALWIPLGARPAPGPSDGARDHRNLRVLGHLAPNATIERAASDVAAIAASLDRSFPPAPVLQRAGQSDRAWSAKSLADLSKGNNPLRRIGLVLAGFVGLVLFVACTNLANLVLARGTARQREFAVRHALGASRWRLVRELFSESLLLAIAGAVLSYIVFRSVQLVMTVDFHITDPMGGRSTLPIRPDLDTATLALAGTSLLISLAVFGLEPALQLTRSRDIRGRMASAADGGGPLRTVRHRLLLRWQVAISAGFFIVATMFVKYTIAEARHDSGVEMGRLGVAILNVQMHQLDEARVRRMLDRVVEDARAEPAIEALSVSAGLPFGVASTPSLSVVMPGQNGKDELRPVTAIEATPGIFRALGVRIVRGRGFEDRDRADVEPLVVLSEFAARQLFGSADVVGRQLLVRRPGPKNVPMTVIGIARDTDVRSIFADPAPLAYVPLTGHLGPIMAISARSTRDAGLAVRALRELLRRADPDLALDVLGTGRDVLAGAWVFVRAMGMTALALGTLTLLLAMVGLFGIQSHIVSNRTREIGVRMSFGATAGQIQRMILKDGSRPVFEGLAIGLLIGVAGRAIVRYYMELDVEILDPWMLAVVPIPLVLAGFCAGFLPAHRASAIDPNVALRHL